MKVFLELLSILRREKPRIVQTYLFHADIAGRIAARFAGVPIVISSLRNENIGGRIREIILRLTDSLVKSVTAVSGQVARVHARKGTTKPNKLVVISNGVETPGEKNEAADGVRRELGMREGEALIVTVASLEEKKGHRTLLDAAALLRRSVPCFKWAVIGEGKSREGLKRYAAELGIEDYILFLGRREDVGKFLKAGDVFVLSSLWEGLPNALLEAMEAGMPVIATGVGGVPEVVRHRDTGLLTEPADSGGLFRQLEELLKDSSLREALSVNARRFVRENYSIKKTVKELDTLYSRLIKEDG